MCDELVGWRKSRRRRRRGGALVRNMRRSYIRLPMCLTFTGPITHDIVRTDRAAVQSLANQLPETRQRVSSVGLPAGFGRGMKLYHKYACT